MGFILGLGDRVPNVAKAPPMSSSIPILKLYVLFGLNQPSSIKATSGVYLINNNFLCFDLIEM